MTGKQLAVLCSELMSVVFPKVGGIHDVSDICHTLFKIAVSFIIDL